MKKMQKMKQWISWTLLSSVVVLGFGGLTGCEKLSNSMKNVQSDLIGLKRKVEIRSCLDGRLIKVYEGSVRLNPEDKYGASLLINGKKLHTNMCYVIVEEGLQEQPISPSAR